MTIYRITPQHGAPVLRQARGLTTATAAGLREFPEGLQSVEEVRLNELTALSSEGARLPVAARRAVDSRKAQERARAQAGAKAQAKRIKEAVARAEERQKEADRRAAEKAEREAEKKRQARAAARAQRKATREAEKVQAVAPDDARLPWEDCPARGTPLALGKGALIP